MKIQEYYKRLADDEGRSGSLESIAAMLGGELDGRTIRCPSPGRAPDDRSCHVRVNTKRLTDIYIYDCAGPRGAAYAAVRERLKLVALLPTADYGAAAMQIWEASGAAGGTLVETYLRARKITLAPPSALRFNRELLHTPSKPSSRATISRSMG